MLLSPRAERWHTAETPGNPPLHEIASTTAGPHAAASDGTLVAEGEDGWRTVLNDGPAVRDAGLRSMAVTDDGTRLWFVDRSGTLSAYDVESGTRHDLTPPSDGATWVGVAVAGRAGEERGVVAHESGDVRAFVGTGTDVSWGTTTNPTTGDATVAVLAVAPDGTGYVVDTSGHARHTAGNGWRGMGRVDSQAALHGIHAGTKGRVAVAAGDGFLYQHDPKKGSWVARRVTNAPIRAVDSADGTLVVGAGDGDVYVEPSGEQFWQVSHTPTSEPIRDLEADGETVVAVGGRFLTQQTGRVGGGDGTTTPAESDVPAADASTDDDGGLWDTGGKSTSPDEVSQPKVEGEPSRAKSSKEQTTDQPSKQQSEKGAKADEQTAQKTPSKEQSSEEQTSEKQTSKQSSEKQSSEQSSEEQASEQSSEKQSSKQTSEKQASEQSAEKQSSEQSSEKQTSEQSAEKQSSKQTSEKQTSEQSAEKQSSEQSSEEQTSEKQSSKKQTSKQFSEKSSEKQSSKKQTSKQFSEKSSEKQSSKKQTSKQSPEKSSEKQSSKKQSPKQTSEKQSSKQPSQKSSEKQSSEKQSSQKASKTGAESAKQSEQKSAEKRAAEQSDRKQGATEEDLWSDTERHDGLWKSSEGRREQSGQDPLDYFEEHEAFVVVDFDEVDGLADCVTVLADESGDRYAVQLASAIYPERCSDPVSRYREEREELVVEPYEAVDSFEECVGLVSRGDDVYAILVDPELGPEREWSDLGYFPHREGFAVVPYVDVERFDDYVTVVVDDAGERYAVLLEEDV